MRGQAACPSQAGAAARTRFGAQNPEGGTAGRAATRGHCCPGFVPGPGSLPACQPGSLGKLIWSRVKTRGSHFPVGLEGLSASPPSCEEHSGSGLGLSAGLRVLSGSGACAGHRQGGKEAAWVQEVTGGPGAEQREGAGEDVGAKAPALLSAPRARAHTCTQAHTYMYTCMRALGVDFSPWPPTVWTISALVTLQCGPSWPLSPCSVDHPGPWHSVGWTVPGFGPVQCGLYSRVQPVRDVG